MTTTKMRGRLMTIVLATAAALAALTAPAAPAGTGTEPSIVATRLGSPDPRTASDAQDYAPGAVPSTLGSPDARDPNRKTASQAGLIASKLGSPDPRDTPLAEIGKTTTSSFKPNARSTRTHSAAH
jgi:hypothetical protein